MTAIRDLAGAGEPACESFRSRVYSLPRVLGDLLRVAARPLSLWRVWVRGEPEPVLREQIMLAVAHANECRYCVVAHETWALAVGADERALTGLAGLAGLDPERVDPATRVELAWALARLHAGFGPVDDELERALAERRTPRERIDLDTVVRVMTIANLAGNTFDALLARRRGAPAPDSRLADELVIAGAFALLAVPVSLLLSVRGRTTPLGLARRVRAAR